jgi:hypothetical protein
MWRVGKFLLALFLYCGSGKEHAGIALAELQITERAVDKGYEYDHHEN